MSNVSFIKMSENANLYFSMEEEDLESFIRANHITQVIVQKKLPKTVEKVCQFTIPEFHNFSVTSEVIQTFKGTLRGIEREQNTLIHITDPDTVYLVGVTVLFLQNGEETQETLDAAKSKMCTLSLQTSEDSFNNAFLQLVLDQGNLPQTPRSPQSQVWSERRGSDASVFLGPRSEEEEVGYWCCFPYLWCKAKRAGYTLF